MNPADEIAALKARLARSERISYGIGGGAAFLFLLVFAMLVGHGGAISRMQVRVPDSLPVVAKAPEPKAEPKPDPVGVDIVARSFVLKDSAGRRRFDIAVLPDDSVMFGATDAKGFPQLLFLGRPGGCALSLGAGRNVGVISSVDAKGEASIDVGIDHKVSIKTATDYRGAAVVVTGEKEKEIGHLP